MFNIGDSVIFVGHGCGSSFVGREGQILSMETDRGLHCLCCGFTRDVDHFLVDYGDGKIYGAESYELRKKPPYDGNVKSTWSDLIVWKPKEVVTV